MNLTLEEIQNFKGKYPKQLWYLFTIEMWERFCFYGMRGVLVIFMTDQLGLFEKDANLKYGAIQAFIYAFTFIGGIFADKILGFKKSLVFGGIIMALGNLIIAYNPHDLFYFGITCSIIGTGFFKPNISSMVGELYKEDDVRRDAGYGMFYAGINIGGLLGGALCVYLGKYYSWSLCFLAAAVVMIIGLITYFIIRKSIEPIGNSPLLHNQKPTRIKKESIVIIGAILLLPVIYVLIQNSDFTDYFMYGIGVVSLLYLGYEIVRLDRGYQRKVIAAFIFIVMYLIFNAIYEQSGGSLSLFAKDNLVDSLLFFHIDPNIINNSSNSFFIIIFSPLVGLLWVWLADRKLEPNTIIKFGIGFLFLAAGFFLFYSLRFFANADGKSSLNLFTFTWLVITFGELCLGPIGMSIITKLSPKKLFGMMMGMWFLASAFGQFFAGKIGAEMSEANTGGTLTSKLIAYTDGYKTLGIYALIAGIILIIMSPLIKKLMQGVK
ncbi:peptide MFS transporter [Epilithonimonas mollis]|uniref:Proton-dependent oligopeptide transporter, POT family n=1 Tax=Epilithonimonas mollis TaxID=216903 RepID=A0A1M6PH44_9FLAO|nr:peptide MFS transporter [Epilithonimonas mollis]SHK07234.1 proton-dependent oligopeptide transporter, POT family [Epilithonimonas mollis]